MSKSRVDEFPPRRHGKTASVHASGEARVEASGPGLRVDDVMSRELYTLSGDDSIATALELMDAHKIRHAPVVDVNGLVVGIVSDRDLRAYNLPSPLQVRDPGLHSAFLATPLVEVMGTTVICVPRGEPLRTAAEQLLEDGVGLVVVVEPDAPRPCGVISYLDVLRVAIPLL